VTAHRTGEQGLVFRDLLTDLDENIDPNAVFPWFHRNLTKNEAVERLVQGMAFKNLIIICQKRHVKVCG
jgi:Ras GTPase-activating protein 1